MKSGDNKTSRNKHYVAHVMKGGLMGGSDELARNENLDELKQQAKEAVSQNPKLEIIIVKVDAKIEEQIVDIINAGTVNPPSIFQDKGL